MTPSTLEYDHIYKSPKYYFDHLAIREPVAPSTVERMRRSFAGHSKYAAGAPGQAVQTINRPRPPMPPDAPLWRNKRSVWSLPTQPLMKEAHFAAFPRALVEPCILAGCPPRGVVLDPFMGSGTTAMTAKALGRRYIGFELNPDYLIIAEKRIKEGR